MLGNKSGIQRNWSYLWNKQTHQSMFFHGLSACFSTAKWLPVTVFTCLSNSSIKFLKSFWMVSSSGFRQGEEKRCLYPERNSITNNLWLKSIAAHSLIDQHANLKNRYLIFVMQHYHFLPACIQCLRLFLQKTSIFQSPYLPPAKDLAALHHCFHTQQETPTPEKGLGS